MKNILKSLIFSLVIVLGEQSQAQGVPPVIHSVWTTNQTPYQGFDFTSTAIGTSATASQFGTSYGFSAISTGSGTAIGIVASANNAGVAVGYGATAGTGGIPGQTNIAIGDGSVVNGNNPGGVTNAAEFLRGIATNENTVHFWGKPVLTQTGNGSLSLNAGVSIPALQAYVSNNATGISLNGGVVAQKSPAITSKLWMIGDSIFDQLFASGGAPYGAAAAWCVHGGGSNQFSVLFTNNTDYFFNGGYYPSNNSSVGLQFTNYMQAAKGYQMNFDNAASINGGTSAQWGFGYPAGQTSWQDQDISSQVFDGSGNFTANTAFFNAFTNVLRFSNTNTIYLSYVVGGVTYTYTNPFYRGVVNYTTPTNGYFTQTNSGSYVSVTLHGKAGATLNTYFFSPKAPGSKWTPPYINTDDHNLITCVPAANYVISNSPASNGVAGTFILGGGQNDWSQLFTYLPDSTWTNYYADCEFFCQSNVVEKMVQKGFNCYICTVPFSPSFGVGTLPSNGITAYNTRVRNWPIPGVQVIDWAAINLFAQSTAAYFIDTIHPSSALQTTDAVAFASSMGISNSIPNPLYAGGGGNYDGSALTNIPVSALTASFYSGSTNVGGTVTALTIVIGHTMSNTNYIPSVSFMGSALATAVVPTYSARTPTNFVLNLTGTGFASTEALGWTVIYSP